MRFNPFAPAFGKRSASDRLQDRMARHPMDRQRAGDEPAESEISVEGETADKPHGAPALVESSDATGRMTPPRPTDQTQDAAAGAADVGAELIATSTRPAAHPSTPANSERILAEQSYGDHLDRLRLTMEEEAPVGNSAGIALSPLAGPRLKPATPPATVFRDDPASISTGADWEEPASEPLPPGEFDDVAVTIGRVVSCRGSVIWGALFDDHDGSTGRAAKLGAMVSMRGPDSRVFGIVNALHREQQSGKDQVERTMFEVQLLGEIAEAHKGFQRGVSSFPPLDAPVTTVTLRDIATIYARPRAANVHIGTLRHNRKVPAFVLTDSLLGKHFAVLGTTGTGKSCAVTVILRSILDEHPCGHIVLLDPHNEYATAFADRAELLNPSNLQLPYWLLNFEEISQVLLRGNDHQRELQSGHLQDAILRAKQLFGGDHAADVNLTVDAPIPYRLSDLVAILQDGMGAFNKSDQATLYLSLINRIEQLRTDPRYGFMFAGLSVRDTMRQTLAQILRIPTNGRPITIIDLSGVPSEIVDVVVSVLCRMTFELAIWSERGKAPPILLVCEEAHRYVPEDQGVGFAPTRRMISRIAKEGRKYGVTLCLVSQRPSELAVSSLTQCNTIFALRLSNEHDQAFVARALPENARWLTESLPALNTQEAIVVGDGVTVPVHIRFKDLPQQHRPGGHDPSFARHWRQEPDDQFLSKAIDRWRRQIR